MIDIGIQNKKDILRDKINGQVEKYLQEGGEIQHIPFGQYTGSKKLKYSEATSCLFNSYVSEN